MIASVESVADGESSTTADKDGTFRAQHQPLRRLFFSVQTSAKRVQILTELAAGGLIVRFLGVGIVTARETVMMTAFCIVLALVAAGFFTEVIAAASAPLGYQDENGFHFGRPKAAHPTNSDLQNPS